MQCNFYNSSFSRLITGCNERRLGLQPVSNIGVQPMSETGSGHSPLPHEKWWVRWDTGPHHRLLVSQTAAAAATGCGCLRLQQSGMGPADCWGAPAPYRAGKLELLGSSAPNRSSAPLVCSGSPWVKGPQWNAQYQLVAPPPARRCSLLLDLTCSISISVHLADSKSIYNCFVKKVNFVERELLNPGSVLNFVK